MMPPCLCSLSTLYWGVKAVGTSLEAAIAGAGVVVGALTRKRWRVLDPVTSQYHRADAPVPPAAYAFQHGMKG